MNKTELYQHILAQTEVLIAGNGTVAERLEAICRLLRDEVHYFDWVGFYLVDEENPRELILGPYVGDSTDHTRIAFGQGICGQAAEREETFVVQDVAKEDNYLSCSIHVKSEIVVPVFNGKKLVGELDIDSHQLNPFSEEDRQYLEEVAARVGPLL